MGQLLATYGTFNVFSTLSMLLKAFIYVIQCTMSIYITYNMKLVSNHKADFALKGLHNWLSADWQ
jgi:hypothetical protein